MVQPILPPYVVELLPDKTNATAVIGWLFFGISAAGAIASILAGRVIGRIGIQRVLLIAAIGVAVFLIPMGFVNSVIALSVLAIVMSLFGGFLTTSAVTLLPTVVTAAALSSMFGLYQSVQALSAQLGPAVGGIIAANLSYSATFFIAGAILVFLGLPMFAIFKRIASVHKVIEEPLPHQIEKSVDSQTPSTGR